MPSVTQLPDADEEEFNWDALLDDLPHYVQLELEGQNADVTYPLLAFQIRTSVECQAAYQYELRQQSLARVDAVTLRQTQQWLQQQQVAAPLTPAPDWLEQTIDQGRAWLEAGTMRWRQVQLRLANLRFGPPSQPALAGLMSDERAAPSLAGALQVAPQDASFELSLAVSPERGARPDLYQAEVTLTLLDRFGDYSGVDLYLTWEAESRMATTDARGRALFSQLPAAQLKAMSLIVILPEE